MTDQERAAALNEWHLGSMNDGLFIIDTPPRPSTDEVHHDRTGGPTMVLNVTDLPHKKARAIVDAHNRALRLLAATPAASPRPKTIFDSRSHWNDVAWANGPVVFAALRDLLDAVNERPSLRGSIESVTISRAENAVAQVLSQKPQPADQSTPPSPQ